MSSGFAKATGLGSAKVLIQSKERAEMFYRALARAPVIREPDVDFDWGTSSYDYTDVNPFLTRSASQI
ncbi:hypothetical protein BGZ50_002085 [Haplosporangium sp. Z 11]|nr:hypothetical protein BGZ50_002085 [Haplosporangium sp. Z 11]